MKIPAYVQSIQRIGPDIQRTGKYQKFTSTEPVIKTDPLFIATARSMTTQFLLMIGVRDIAIAVILSDKGKQNVWLQEQVEVEQETNSMSKRINAFVINDRLLKIKNVIYIQQKITMEMLELIRSRYTIKSNIQPTSTDIAVARFIKFLERVAYAETKIQQARFQLALQCRLPDANMNLYHSIGGQNMIKNQEKGIKIEQFVQLCLMSNTLPKINQGVQKYKNILITYFEMQRGELIKFDKFVSILNPRYKQIDIIENKQDKNKRLSKIVRNNRSCSSLYDLHRNNRHVKSNSQINNNNFLKKFVNFISIVISEYLIVDRLKQELGEHIEDLTIYLHKKYQLTSSNMLSGQESWAETTNLKHYYLLIDKNKIKQFMNDHQMYNKLTYGKICNYLFGTDNSIQSIYLLVKKYCGLDRQISPHSNNHKKYNNINYKSSDNSIMKREYEKENDKLMNKWQLQDIYDRINQLQTKISLNTKHGKNLYQQFTLPNSNNNRAYDTEYGIINNRIDKQVASMRKNKQINRSFKLPNQKVQNRNRTDYHHNQIFDSQDLDQFSKYRQLTRAQSQAAFKIECIEKRAMKKFMQNRHIGYSNSPTEGPIRWQNKYSVEQALEILDSKDNHTIFKKAGKIRAQY